MALHGHLLLALLVSIALAAAAAVASDRGTPLDLVPAAPGASLAERARDDRHRHAYITSVLRSRGGGRRRVAAEVVSPSSFSMPLTSGAYSGTGQFLARVQVGTPPQQFLLVVDTGSDLTWVKCHGGGQQSPTSTGNVFLPADSTSWAPIPCSSDTCKLDVPFSLAKCPSPTSPCTYDYKYKEASASARGVAGTETATVGAAKLDGVVVGCTATNAGESFASAADGVLSLGYANISFATRAASRLGGGRFAYCLVDHLAPRHVTGYLAFGCQTPPPPKRSKSNNQTPLLLDPTMPFYAVTVESVHVAGAALDVPGEVWDAAKGGGVILDSGTTLTVLAAPAYKAVVAAISERLAGVPRVRFDPFEYCYNWTSRGPEVPKLAVRFAGSAVFEPPGKSYVIDAAPGIKCIGVQEGEWPGVSVFGNILQQEHLWEFDLQNQWVRFMPSRCTK